MKLAKVLTCVRKSWGFSMYVQAVFLVIAVYEVLLNVLRCPLTY